MLLRMQPGIGDTVWCFHKLQDYLKSKGHFDIEVSKSGFVRAKEVMHLVGARKCGTHNLLPNEVEARTIKTLAELKDGSYVSINKWLEGGNRIEDWLPELPMKWDIDFATSNDSRIRANTILDNSEYPVGIYTSSLTNNLNPTYKGMGVKGWATRISEILDFRPNATIVLIGADYDRTLLDPLKKVLEDANVKHKICIGEEIGVTIELIKQLKFILSYPSGIGILGNILRIPTLMYMPQWLLKMHDTWLHPSEIDETAVHLQFLNVAQTNERMRSMIWKL